MKLPENKKERIQMLVLAAIGGIAVLYAVTQLGVKPLIHSRTKLVDELQELRKKLDKAKRELSYEPQIKREHEQAVAAIEKLSSDSVPRPVFGSYLLSVTETLETAARTCGFQVGDIQEVGIQEIPGKKKDRYPRAFKSYGVRVNGVAGLEQTYAMLQRIEEQNPLLCVTEIHIAGQPDVPEQHLVSFRVEWPIPVPPEANPPATPQEKPKGSAPDKKEEM